MLGYGGHCSRVVSASAAMEASLASSAFVLFSPSLFLTAGAAVDGFAEVSTIIAGQ